MKKLILSVAVLTAFSTLACSGIYSTAQAQTTTEIARGNCKAASDKCQKTLDYCNQKKGKLGEANVTDSLKDGIAVLNAAEKILARNSILGSKTSLLAIEACQSIAKSCDQFPGDNQMQGCANEVRKCVGNLQKVSTKKE